jgi:hypothetical protein
VWQLKHRFARIGRTRISKNSRPPGGESAAQTTGTQIETPAQIESPAMIAGRLAQFALSTL